MEALLVWNRNINMVNRIIHKVKRGFKLEDTFVLEAENIFHSNFEKYYKDDFQYMRFFSICLKNKAKNKYRQKVSQEKLVSQVLCDNGEYKDVFDVLELSVDSFESEYYVKELSEVLQKEIGEVEYFVYEQLLEGWKNTDIAEMLGCSLAEVAKIKQFIQGELRRLMLSDGEAIYLEGPFEVDGVIYDYKLIDLYGEDYCTKEQLEMWNVKI